MREESPSLVDEFLLKGGVVWVGDGGEGSGNECEVVERYGHGVARPRQCSS
jgi:hypothetical protein